MIRTFQNCVVYEIHTWMWLGELSQTAGKRITLANVPDDVWDALAALGVNVVWFMGVWERSPAGQRIALRNSALLSELRAAAPLHRRTDLVGSPYCIRSYAVDPNLGGPTGLATARQALAKRGIQLWLDFVPNHVAPDHDWVSTHPEWLIQGTHADLRQSPDAFMKVARRVFAHGRDPYFPPWSDVLQVNAFNPHLREAAIGELLKIADQCDGVRCDMAMLLMNDVFARTWGQFAGPAPEQEYWTEVIAAVKVARPGFQFIAEAYWDLESPLLEQGFDGCYDKRLYDSMVHESAASVRSQILRWDGVQSRLVRFLENHDEARAARTIGWPKTRAASVVLLTLPGIRLLHDGQLEGRRVKAPIHLACRPEEHPNELISEHYSRLLQVISHPVFRSGEWLMCESPETSGHPQNNLLAWCWRQGSERRVILINYGETRVQARVHIPWPELSERVWESVELLARAESNPLPPEVTGSHLSVHLEAWASRILQIK